MAFLVTEQFLCPDRSTTEVTRLGWLKEHVREGEAFLKNQIGMEDAKRGKDVIAGVDNSKIPASLSRINVNLQKRLVRDIVGTLSNIRPLWGYATDNSDLDQQCEILNKLLLAWYQTTFADRGIKKGLQFAAVTGTGYIGPDWSSAFWTRGRGDITLKTWAADDVIPVQVPADNDIQRAYSVTFREAVPINLARAMFPTMAGKIVPDRNTPSGLRKGLNKVSSFLSPVLSRFATDPKSKKAVDTPFPMVDIYQSYIMDLSVNEGPNPVVMGEPGTYWNYTVPVLNSDVPDGVDESGQPRTRKVGVEEAMLYPFRRLITWCSSGILRDDTSYWWHGMVPAVPMKLDSWAWEFLGYSMVRDLDTIEMSNNQLRRAMDDSANARLRPALMYDDRSLAKSLVESLDTRQPGQAVGVDFTVGDNPLRPILPPQYYDAPQWIPAMIQSNEEMMKYLSGVNDFTAIAKARQIPSSDSIEKLMDMAGPVVQDISREMESTLGRLGEMIKCLFFEFYTAARRLQILGKDGLTEEDQTYFEPGKMIPSHMPGENPENGPSHHSIVERARHYMNSFFFKITPGSMHQITQMSRKLLYIQLQKAGLPIDPWTMAMVCDIPNFGPPPSGTTTVMQRFVAWERMRGELMAHIQANTQTILAAAQMQVQAAALGAAAATQGGQQGQEAQQPKPTTSSPALGQNEPGRPPSFNGIPVIAQKDQGTRSTITSNP